jgi:uncharacterized membrane protein YcaP (DUF421 family)
MDWTELFALRTPLLEIVVRGTAVYLFIFLVFRFVLRRDVGAVGLADLLLLVLVADAAQNAMSANYHTITDGFVLIATIVGWNWLLDWLSYRSRFVARFTTPRILPLVVDGRLQRQNLEREMIGAEELMAKLREQGVESLAQVKYARLEADGEVSVIRRRGRPAKAGPRSRAGAV